MSNLTSEIDPDTSEQKYFCDWLSQFLSSCDVRLNIPASPKVPVSIKVRCTDINEVLGNYTWKTSWQIDNDRSVSVDWPSTKASLTTLRKRLKAALLAGNEEDLLESCRATIDWGGGQRSRGKGADAFLKSKHREGKLSSYLLSTRDVMQLSYNGSLERIEHMNSMLTKIYAFMADDGLPIYDSRVSAAIAALVAIYAQDTRRNWSALPADIRFPLVYPSSSESRRVRSVSGINSDSLSSGSLRGSSSRETLAWASAKKRLGKVIYRTLRTNNDLFPNEGEISARMHALEASLFMIGYDLTCLQHYFRS